MTSASSPHSVSIFTNSCRTTPRNPRTGLPVDRLGQYAGPNDQGDQARGTTATGTGLLVSSSSKQSSRSSRTVRGHPTQLFSEREGRPSTAPTVVQSAKSREEGSLDMSYSALFATLLESNALLRDEIQQMRQEHARTMSALHFLNTENGTQSTQPRESEQEGRGAVTAPHNLRETAGNSRDRVQMDSFSTQVLKYAWVRPTGSGSFPQPPPPLEPRQQHAEDLSSGASSPRVESPHRPVHSGSTSPSSTPAHSDTEEGSAGEEEEEVETSDSSTHSIPASGAASISVEAPMAAFGEHSSSSSSISRSESSSSAEAEENFAKGDPFAPPGLVAVGRMWDDFSVEDYAPYEPDKEDKKPKEEVWRPHITIPKPFNMTLRDERTPRKKTKSMLMAERERMEKEAREEAELKKQFRSTPVPASTYIPLYELINAKNHQRREQVRKESKEILQSTERPFSFTRREEEKRRLKHEKLRQDQLEKARSEKEVKFQAQPVPKHLFDPQVKEQIREEEEYRRVRVKMRAEEMLANSKLPGSMHLRSSSEYTVGTLRKRRLDERQSHAFMTREHSFHPRVNPRLPDYDQLFRDFQQELLRRKQSNRSTSAEPFYLRTQLIPSRKEQIEQDLKRDEEVLRETRWPFMAPRSRPSQRSPAKSKSSSVPYPAQLTETAKLRQSLTQEKLAQAAEKECADEQQRQEKRNRQKELQRAVSRKSIMNDPTAWLEDRKRLKLQELRRMDKERKETYHQELQDMQQRLESRPLLVDQPARAAARRSAEARYAATLKRAGLSEEQIQTMNEGPNEH